MVEDRAADASDEGLFSRPIDLERIQQEDIEFKIAATPEERELLAGFLDIDRLDGLEAEVTITAWRRKGAKVTGRFQAIAEQTCVVTLEPMECRYAESFVRTYLPAEALSKQVRLEDVIDAEDDDPPDPLEGGIIDVGSVVLEELALVIDPYPRKDGVEIDSRYIGGDEDGSDAPQKPFAKLLALKKQGDEGSR